MKNPPINWWRPVGLWSLNLFLTSWMAENVAKNKDQINKVYWTTGDHHNNKPSTRDVLISHQGAHTLSKPCSLSSHAKYKIFHFSPWFQTIHIPTEQFTWRMKINIQFKFLFMLLCIWHTAESPKWYSYSQCAVCMSKETKFVNQKTHVQNKLMWPVSYLEYCHSD